MPRILVIDDDSQVRDMLAAMLSRDRYDVFAAESGRKGLDFMKDKSVDLAIVDMLMPEMDGLETIRHVRHDHPDVAVIALSGGGPFGRFNLLDQAERLGAAASLRKPVDWEELTTVVGGMFEADDDSDSDDDDEDVATAGA